jgi:hypothetical protein
LENRQEIQGIASLSGYYFWAKSRLQCYFNNASHRFEFSCCYTVCVSLFVAKESCQEAWGTGTRVLVCNSPVVDIWTVCPRDTEFFQAAYRLTNKLGSVKAVTFPIRLSATFASILIAIKCCILLLYGLYLQQFI